MADLFGKLKSGAGKVAFEAEKMTRLNRAQGEQGQLNRQVESLYTKLGELYYQRRTSQQFQGPEFEELCRQVDQLELKVQEKTEEVERITAETYAPQGAPVQAPAEPAVTVSAAGAPFSAAPAAQPPLPQTKACPNCGKEMGAAVKFCPDCGTKMI